jgi:hypothetical protein
MVGHHRGKPYTVSDYMRLLLEAFKSVMTLQASLKRVLCLFVTP